MSIGPFSIRNLLERYKMKQELAESALEKLVLYGEVLKLKDSEAAADIIYCSRKVFERIKKKTVLLARSDIKPKEPQVYCSYLLRHHGIGEDVLSPEEKLENTIAMLQGLFMPVSWWEDFILPSRVKKYDPKMLDYLCSSGVVKWVGRTNKNTREVAFYPVNTSEDFMESEEPVKPQDCTLDKIEEEVLRVLTEKGACFLKDLVKFTGTSTGELLNKLERLVWNGVITNDAFSVARYYLDLEKKNSSWAKYNEAIKNTPNLHRRRTPNWFSDGEHISRLVETPQKKGNFSTTEKFPFESGRYNTYPNMGRWYLSSEVTLPRNEKGLKAHINRLLDRYGIISKDIADCDKEVFKWSDIYSCLKNSEFSSGIKRGFYISGLSGIQFARDRDLELIRMQDSTDGGEDYITLCSCDPANPYKDILSKASSIKTAKSQGTAVVFANGLPVLILKDYGNNIIPLTDDRTVVVKAARSFVESFTSRALWTTRRNIFMEYWGEKAAEEICKIEDSPIYEELLDMGFDRGYNGITLWRHV